MSAAARGVPSGMRCRRGAEPSGGAGKEGGLRMATEEEIVAEVRSFGRLSPHQEDVLYGIALKQDELGRESTCLLLEDLQGNPLYEPLIEREYLTFDTFDHGGAHRVASLYVTLKGLRYCILFADELSRRHGELQRRRVAGR